MARIFVTGGAGFIGSHVVDHCIEAGHQVAVLDNLTTGHREQLNSAADFHEQDIRDPGLKDTLRAQAPDYVLHLAAQVDVRKSLTDPCYDADANVCGSLNLLECALQQGVNKVVFASTGGAIYGEPSALPADEATPPQPLSHYGTSKLCFEHYLKLYYRLYGLPYTILRLPNVYGPRQSPEGEAGVCSILAGRMLAGETPVLYGHGEPLRDYVYVEDIARAHLAALENGEGQTLNLGSGKGTSVRQLFEQLQQLTGFDGTPRLKPLRKGEIKAIYITGDKAREVLGWQPEIALDEGLRRLVAYLHE